jgi:uncharacterized protein (DUF433 family)
MAALRALKDRLRNRTFTTAEASAMLGLSGVQVNNLIDELAQLGIAQSGDRKRAIEHRGLFSMKLCRDLILWDVGPALRLKVIRAALDAPRKKFVSIVGTNISAMQVGNYRKEASDRIRELQNAENAVSSKPEIMRGEPCMRGTRVPAYWVAEIVEADGEAEAKKTYPQLTEKQIRFAHLYALANPRRGRPKEIKWPVGRAIKGRSRTRTVTLD